MKNKLFIAFLLLFLIGCHQSSNCKTFNTYKYAAATSLEVGMTDRDVMHTLNDSPPSDIDPDSYNEVFYTWKFTQDTDNKSLECPVRGYTLIALFRDHKLVTFASYELN